MRIVAYRRRWGIHHIHFFPAYIEVKDNARGQVDFLADTGATASALSERDAERIGISCENLPRGQPVHGIGGVASTREIRHEVKVSMVSTAHRLVQVAAKRMEIIEGRNDLPSILGRGFLDQLNFRLVYDGSINAVYLER